MGISAAAIRQALEIVYGGGSLRGAALVLEGSGRRVEPDKKRGIRASRHWDRAGNWTLLVCPPEKATWRLSAEEHNDLGVFFERSGMLESATQQYVAAAQTHPGNSYYRMNLGNVLLKQRRLREAANSFARAVELDAQNADAMNNLAYTYSEMGQDLDGAAKLCERAAALLPARRAYYLDTLGGVLLKQGKRDEARAAFAQALAATTDRQQSLRAAIQQHLSTAGAR